MQTVGWIDSHWPTGSRQFFLTESSVLADALTERWLNASVDSPLKFVTAPAQCLYCPSRTRLMRNEFEWVMEEYHSNHWLELCLCVLDRTLTNGDKRVYCMVLSQLPHHTLHFLLFMSDKWKRVNRNGYRKTSIWRLHRYKLADKTARSKQDWLWCRWRWSQNSVSTGRLIHEERSLLWGCLVQHNNMTMILPSEYL